MYRDMINRDIEFQRLFEAVVSRNNIQLIADSGMGKSHIVETLINRLSGHRFCFEINLRGIQSSRELLYKLLENVNEAAEESYNLKYQLKRILEERPVPLHIDEESFNSWTKDLLVGLQNVSLDFLFIFEDIDQWECKDSLTTALNHFSGARNSQALVTSMEADEKLRSYQRVTIEAVREASLSTEMKEKYDLETLKEVIERSGGNTSFFIEIMKSIGNGSPARAVKRVLEQYHPIFYNFRHRFTPLQWKLLLAVACEGCVSHPHAFEFLLNYRLGAASSVERALRNLSDSGIIRQTPDGWKVSDIRFQRWLVNLYPQVESLSHN